MKKFALNILGIFAFGVMAGLMQAEQAATAPATAPAVVESVRYFEPTQADYDCCHVAVKAQQAAYVKARDLKDWATAQYNALFWFAKAWLSFNQAMSIVQSVDGWNSEVALNEALLHLKDADTYISKARAVKHHKAEWTDCETKVSHNREIIEKQIASIS